MNSKSELKKLLLIAAVFLACFYLPVDKHRFTNAIFESLYLVKWYAKEHVLLCLVPAFFIAGAISVFVSQASVMKYLGARANKTLAYGVASVSGTILAVCSCTVLPLFAGIYRMGAGLGPAAAFLYAGPAINVLAIILTARVLGLELGVARAVGAIAFSIIIGLIMHIIYRKEELNKSAVQMSSPEPQVSRPLYKTSAFFAAMVAVLVFANWARSGDVRAVFLCCPGGLATYTVEGTIVEQTSSEVRIKDKSGSEHAIAAAQFIEAQPVNESPVYDWIYKARWAVVGLALALLIAMSLSWYGKTELRDWTESSWGYAKLILPLLLLGILVSGLLLGRPGHEGLIPNKWIEWAVGGNSLRANLFASVAGAFMYFATLTEVPILQGLIGSGMGKGPALALLLAGPALSLPSMLVIRSVMGTQKTVVYIFLVMLMATTSGMIYGTFF